MSDIETWWRDLPILTKWLFVGSMVATIGANIGLINPYLLVLDWNKIFYNFQLWRLVTCFLFHGKLGFPFLIHMLFLYSPPHPFYSHPFFLRGGGCRCFDFFIFTNLDY